ncbi:MAG: hypothetical protein AB7T49_19950 [Oligoflexales bacterium]
MQLQEDIGKRTNSRTKGERSRGDKCAKVVIRIGQGTRFKLEQLLGHANRDRPGRKVKADDLIRASLELLSADNLEEIGARLLTNKERIEILYQKLSKSKQGLTRDEFFGMLLEGKVTI